MTRSPVSLDNVASYSALPPIPPDREGGSTPLHRLLIFTHRLGLIRPALLLPAWIALIAIAAWPWHSRRLAVAAAAALFLAADWLMLALLPVKGRSWGPVTPSLLGLTLLRVFLSWPVALLGDWLLALPLLILLEIAVSVAATYATWIEPFRLTVTRQQLQLPGWPAEAPLRILHISDLHFERFSTREAALLEQVEKLQPDLILLTGDYLNLSSVYNAEAQQETRKLLGRLHAPLGVYAITGSPPVDVPQIVPRIFANLDIRWLDDEALPIAWRDVTFWLLGVRCSTNLERDGAALERLKRQVPAGMPSLLLYHSPDLMPEAARQGITLYLAGHTHGGQLRLPLYGALLTSSQWGKRYEMGRYQQDYTTLYVSRGLGMEGLGAPRARFLSPPEIILWTVSSSSQP